MAGTRKPFPAESSPSSPINGDLLRGYGLRSNTASWTAVTNRSGCALRYPTVRGFTVRRVGFTGKAASHKTDLFAIDRLSNLRSWLRRPQWSATGSSRVGTPWVVTCTQRWPVPPDLLRGCRAAGRPHRQRGGLQVPSLSGSWDLRGKVMALPATRERYRLESGRDAVGCHMWPRRWPVPSDLSVNMPCKKRRPARWVSGYLAGLSQTRLTSAGLPGPGSIWATGARRPAF